MECARGLLGYNGCHFDLNHIRRCGRLDIQPMAAIVFTCPNTRDVVQHWMADDDPLREGEYVGLTCGACGKVHFVNQDGQPFRPSATARRGGAPK